MFSTEFDQQVALFASPVIAIPGSLQLISFGSKRHRRAVRSQESIILAILEACRTPTVQHWVMVKARLGYDTFWKHMNELVSQDMINIGNDGFKTLYSVNQKGIVFLHELEETQI